MRVLVLFRGAPGSGKSSFIKEYGLEPYTLSADDIRLKISSPALTPSGNFNISQKHDKDVWKILFNLLEKRMAKGEFTVIDATNSKTSEMSRYKEIADKYRYRIYIIDMADIPIEIAKERNANRFPLYKRVPEKAIDKMYSRFATQKVPSGIKVIKPEEFNSILYKPMDITGQYEKIHHIGDIHSSYTALKEYLITQFLEDKGLRDVSFTEYEIIAYKNKNTIVQFVADEFDDDLAALLNPRHLFVFCGDYLDRGIETIETLKFFLNIYNMPNVILLEGNHESLPLRNYAHNIDDYPRYFRQSTLLELNAAVSSGEISKKELKQFCRKLGQICYYKYGDKTVFVSHGGISNLSLNPIYISTEQLIRGVGEYDDYVNCAESFEKTTDQNTYQISGHRNVTGVGVKATDRCFNLEGQVEYGGHLRVVTLDKNGFETHEIKNNVFREKKEKVIEVTLPKENLTNDDIVKQLRNSPYVKEKKMGNISSFNFTQRAFFNKQWDEQTTKARGLFIDTRDNSIAMRGYDKFMKINETEETKIMNLKHKLKFPVNIYVKENGFLGLISLNKDTNELMFATKSVLDYASTQQDLVNVFKELFNEITTDVQKQNVLEYLRVFNKTIICECVHQEKDPHIIEYDNNQIYLLDIIENDFDDSKLSYDELYAASKNFGLKCKEKAFTLNNWEDFYGWYLEVTDEDYLYNGRHIEGFVIEDSDGFMVKVKLFYYNFWKMMRGITYQVLKRGYLEKTSSLYNAESNYYYGWLREHRDEYIRKNEEGKIVFGNVNIIGMRRKFLRDMGDKING